jgi:hypothetical protein
LAFSFLLNFINFFAFAMCYKLKPKVLYDLINFEEEKLFSLIFWFGPIESKLTLYFNFLTN